MHYTVATVFCIIKVPSFGDVNIFSQIIILKQTLISGSPFLTANNKNKHHTLSKPFPITNDINFRQMFL